MVVTVTDKLGFKAESLGKRKERRVAANRSSSEEEAEPERERGGQDQSDLLLQQMRQRVFTANKTNNVWSKRTKTEGECNTRLG